jgi:class 3 adenylate cyclase
MGVIVMILYDYRYFAIAMAIIAVYTTFYTIVVDCNILGLRDRKWFWYSSAITDGCFLALITILFGSINSVTTSVYLATVVVGALNTWIRKGLMIAITGSISYIAIGYGTWVGWLPKINILGAGSEVSLPSLITYSSVFVVTMFMIWGSVSGIAHRNEELLAENEVERRKSDALLLNVLPAAVADELKRRGRYAPRIVDQATVLFTDFVGFSSSTRGADPQKVLDHLDRLFKTFDAIVDEYGLEKIKTMGDGYLCAAGLIDTSPSGAVEACRAALAMLEAVKAKKVDGGFPWGVRIGLHTGPVIAGIIGTTKFSYDIWGDTVNIASRMESSGIADGINVSAATCTAAGDDFCFKPRGLVPIKGGEALEMFELTGKAHKE